MIRTREELINYLNEQGTKFEVIPETEEMYECIRTKYINYWVTENGIECMARKVIK